MIFNKQEFDDLRTLVFAPGYPGYKPEVREIPNGDGVVDAEKRFSHVAAKYLGTGSDPRLWRALKRCHKNATDVALSIGLTDEWMPDLNASCLRVLEYPPGSTSAKHTDFDLFTLLAYRDPIEGLEFEHDAFFAYRDESKLRQLAPGLHFGELMEYLPVEPGKATPHWVEASNEWQYSAVYFVLPSPYTMLPDGRRVGTSTEEGSWLHERYSRSRTYK